MTRLKNMQKLDKYTRLFDIKNNNNSKGLDMLIIEQNLKHSKPLVINSFNLFQTPQKIVEKMLSFVSTKNKTVLEPSAGLGMILKNIKDADKITAIDNSKDCVKYLYENFRNINLIEGDFLKLDLPKFDLAVMNPPFKNGLDIKHILRAKEICKEVVFLCYNGSRQNKILKPICDYWEVLPENSFKESGTNASVCLGLIRN